MDDKETRAEIERAVKEEAERIAVLKAEQEAREEAAAKQAREAEIKERIDELRVMMEEEFNEKLRASEERMERARAAKEKVDQEETLEAAQQAKEAATAQQAEKAAIKARVDELEAMNRELTETLKANERRIEIEREAKEEENRIAALVAEERAEEIAVAQQALKIQVDELEEMNVELNGKMKNVDALTSMLKDMESQLKAGIESPPLSNYSRELTERGPNGYPCPGEA
jgi:hypothetical protein